MRHFMTRCAALGLILIGLSASATAWAKPEPAPAPATAVQPQSGEHLAWDRVGAPLPMAS